MRTYFDHFEVALLEKNRKSQDKKVEVKLILTFPIFLKKGYLKMVKIGSNLLFGVT